MAEEDRGDGEKMADFMTNYVSSDEEKVEGGGGEEVDPFRHRIRMTRWEWARTYALGVVLVPLRLLVILLLLLAAWIVATVSLAGLSADDLAKRPIVGGWRKRGKTMETALGRLCFGVAGFTVTVKGERASAEEAPILVAGPHTSFWDGFIIFWNDNPYSVSRQENRALPIMGKCIELMQLVSVKREDRGSRHDTVAEIVRRTHLHEAADPNDRWPRLIMFPEGSCSNGKALMSFKPGAFCPGKPVQPVLVRYPNRINTTCWTWNQPHGSKTVFFATLAQPFSRAELEYLPVYRPSKREVEDPKLFASNVRRVMAEALAVPTCDLTFEEAKARYAKFYKKKIKDKEA